MPILDTCFLVDVLRGDAKAARLLDLLRQGSRPLGTDAHCEYELYFGVGRSRRPTQDLQAVESLLADLVRFPFTPEAARMAGLLEARLAAEGKRPPVLDLLIGCAAVVAGEPVVTRNRAHFADIPGLEVLSY